MCLCASDSLAWLVQDVEQDVGQDISNGMLEPSAEQTGDAQAETDFPQAMAGDE